MKKFKFNKVSIVVLTVAFILGSIGPMAAQAVTIAIAPDLGTADGYSVFGAKGITNTGLGSLTNLWGDAGDNGFGSTGLLGEQVDGILHIIANVTIGSDITTAYGFLRDQIGATAKSLTGTVTVTPGLYTVNATEVLNGTVTLDGAGVYVFRSDSAFTVSSGATMNLINGATACNVFWQIPTSMTIGTDAKVEGTIITESASITLDTGATLKGRALAGGEGQVTLLSNQITEPTCVTPPDDTEEDVPSVSHSSSGSTPTYGCKDPTATNYNYFSSSRPSLCTYASVVKVVTPTVIVPKLPKTGFPTQTWYESLLNNFLNLFK